MAISERIRIIFEESRNIAKTPPKSTFTSDLHSSALSLYKDLPRWEKQARAMAYAVVNQQILIEPYDKIIGRVYYRNEVPVSEYDPDFDFNTQPRKNAEKNDQRYDELCRHLCNIRCTSNRAPRIHRLQKRNICSDSSGRSSRKAS